MYYTYILRSDKNGKYYIGCTGDLDRRITEHNNGLSKFTKGKGPWIICYSEQFNNLIDARKREKQIKSWKKRAAIEKLINGAFV